MLFVGFSALLAWRKAKQNGVWEGGTWFPADNMAMYYILVLFHVMYKNGHINHPSL